MDFAIPEDYQFDINFESVVNQKSDTSVNNFTERVQAIFSQNNNKEEAIHFDEWSAQKNISEEIFFDEVGQKKVNDVIDDRNFRLNLDVDLWGALYAGSGLNTLNVYNWDKDIFFMYIGDVSLQNKICFNSSDFSAGSKLTFRVKGIAGSENYFSNLEYNPVKIGIGRTEVAYSSRLNNQYVWLRELWGEGRWGDESSVHAKIGLFPYRLGSGLVLGDAYIVRLPVPVFTSYKDIDQFRAGFNLIAYSDSLHFSLSNYFSITDSYYNDKNIQYNATIAKKNNNGYGLIDVIKLSWNPSGCVDISGYLLWHSDNNQFIEFPRDGKLSFIDIGLNSLLKGDSFNCSFELVGQFGHQDVYALDRNCYYALGGTQQTHLFQDVGVGIDEVWTASRIQPFPVALGTNLPAGETFYDSMDNHFLNSYTRFRREYRNNIQSFFGSLQCARKFQLSQKSSLQVSAAGFVSSGGVSANDSTEKILAHRYSTEYCGYAEDQYANYNRQDKNKNTSYFYGIDQFLTSPYITSLFFLHSEKFNTVLSKKFEQTTYPVFTNRIAVGGGLKWQCEYNRSNVTCELNGLYYSLFNQVRRGYRYPLGIYYQMNSNLILAVDEYLPTLATESLRYASKTLGFELNARAQYTYRDTLKLFGYFGCFFPGSYYDTVKGKNLDLYSQRQMTVQTFSGNEACCPYYNTVLGVTKAMVAVVGLEFKWGI